MVYRVSNNVRTGWRPAVFEVRVYTDYECTVEIHASFEDMSGYDLGYGDGSAAFDNSEATSWRPGCAPCEVGEAWVSFAVSKEIKCVEASNLGEGYGGGNSWNGGIKVEIRNFESSWSTVMESSSGNIAQGKTVGSCQ